MSNREIEHIVPLTPHGTNSTFFTQCCYVAINDDEKKCPRCKKLVIGHDAAGTHSRHMVRWKNATQHWNNWNRK